MTIKRFNSGVLQRIFFDFEFIEGGAAYVMEPISLGMVKESGETFYREFAGVNWNLANDFVLENVRPHLTGELYPLEEIVRDLLVFIGDPEEYYPQFWAYFASYDWVLFCQLFGRMVDLPKGFPKHVLDIKQEMTRLGVVRSDLNFLTNDQEHNALEDAQWNRRVFSYLRGLDTNPAREWGEPVGGF